MKEFKETKKMFILIFINIKIMIIMLVSYKVYSSDGIMTCNKPFIYYVHIQLSTA